MNRKLSVILILSVAVQSTGLQSAWYDNLSWRPSVPSMPSFSMPSVDVNAATEYLKKMDRNTLLALAALGLVAAGGIYFLKKDNQSLEQARTRATLRLIRGDNERDVLSQLSETYKKLGINAYEFRAGLALEFLKEHIVPELKKALQKQP